MTIAPIACSVRTTAPPRRAFELFTANMTQWWGSRTPAPKPAVAVIVEPHQGGRWFERAADGEETLWGCVLVWDPPAKLVLGWQLNSHWVFDPTLLTEVDIGFAPTETGGTLVTLEHRGLERFGAAAAEVASKIGTGWPRQLEQFGTFSSQPVEQEAAV